MESKKKEKRKKKKKMVRRTQGQDGNKDADLLENGLEDTGGGRVIWDEVRELH